MGVKTNDCRFLLNSIVSLTIHKNSTVIQLSYSSKI